MGCTISADEIRRVKALGFLNNKGTDLFNGRVITVNGKITAAQAKAVAEAAEKYGNGEIEFTTRLTIEVRGIHFDNIEPFREYIKKAGLITGGTGSLVRPIVSCKGTTCQNGLYDTFALSEKIHERFYLGYHAVRLPHKFKIATGGCPNNCVKPDLNDLGIIGQLIPNFDKDSRNACKKCPFDAVEGGMPGYRIYIGGRWGKKVAHGIPLSKVFTSEEEVLDTVEKAILLYREQGKTGERFADTIARIGFEQVEKQLLANDLLERKQEILAAKLHLAGASAC